MMRLFAFLIYGECEASVWETMAIVDYYEKGDDRPFYEVLVQKNQYGRVRKVRI